MEGVALLNGFFAQNLAQVPVYLAALAAAPHATDIADGFGGLWRELRARLAADIHRQLDAGQLPSWVVAGRDGCVDTRHRQRSDHRIGDRQRRSRSPRHRVRNSSPCYSLPAPPAEGPPQCSSLCWRFSRLSPSAMSPFHDTTGDRPARRRRTVSRSVSRTELGVDAHRHRGAPRATGVQRYSISTSSGSPPVISTTRQSVLEHEGRSVLLVLAVPVALAIIGAIEWSRHKRGLRIGAGVLLAMGCLASAASIGMFYLPATVALIASGLRTHSERG